MQLHKCFGPIVVCSSSRTSSGCRFAPFFLDLCPSKKLIYFCSFFWIMMNMLLSAVYVLFRWIEVLKKIWKQIMKSRILPKKRTKHTQDTDNLFWDLLTFTRLSFCQNDSSNGDPFGKRTTCYNTLKLNYCS